PHTADPLLVPGSPSGATGAGRPRQLTPRSRVRAIEVHGACWHGAVPSTNASRVETKVTEAALNPAGIELPEGRVMPAGTPAALARSTYGCPPEYVVLPLNAGKGP